MSRHFERSFTTDHLVLSAGAVATVDGGPMTLVVVFRLDQTAPDQGLISGRRSDEGTVWEDFQSGGGLFPSTSAGFRTGVAGLVADTWYMYVTTKAGGSAVLRDHLCVMATDTWTHADRGAALGDGTGPVDHVQIGDATNRIDGYVAAAGVIAASLNDAAVEALRSGLAAWISAGAAAVWRLNDSPVNDLTGGGADQTLLDGTTVDLGVEPPTFDYNVAGPTTGSLAGTLPELTGAITGHAVNRAVLAGSLPELTGSVAASAHASGILSGILPALTGYLVETVEQLPGVLSASGSAPSLAASAASAAILTATGTP